MEPITRLVIGLIAGWLAGLVMKGSGYLALTSVGILRDLGTSRFTTPMIPLNAEVQGVPS